MSRYSVHGEWTDHHGDDYTVVQYADALDKVTGDVFREGAARVLFVESRQPVKVGKGGTVPFFGETAWMDAERLAFDTYKARPFRHR